MRTESEFEKEKKPLNVAESIPTTIPGMKEIKKAINKIDTAVAHEFNEQSKTTRLALKNQKDTIIELDKTIKHNQEQIFQVDNKIDEILKALQDQNKQLQDLVKEQQKIRRGEPTIEELKEAVIKKIQEAKDLREIQQATSELQQPLQTEPQTHIEFIEREAQKNEQPITTEKPFLPSPAEDVEEAPIFQRQSTNIEEFAARLRRTETEIDIGFLTSRPLAIVVDSILYLLEEKNTIQSFTTKTRIAKISLPVEAEEDNPKEAEFRNRNTIYKRINKLQEKGIIISSPFEKESIVTFTKTMIEYLTKKNNGVTPTPQEATRILEEIRKKLA